MTNKEQKEVKDDMKISVYELDKGNIILLAKHHQDTCDQSDCGVSLICLKLFAERNGITFTDKENKYFM